MHGMLTQAASKYIRLCRNPAETQAGSMRMTVHPFLHSHSNMHPHMCQDSRTRTVHVLKQEHRCTRTSTSNGFIHGKKKRATWAFQGGSSLCRMRDLVHGVKYATAPYKSIAANWHHERRLTARVSDHGKSFSTSIISGDLCSSISISISTAARTLSFEMTLHCQHYPLAAPPSPLASAAGAGYATEFCPD